MEPDEDEEWRLVPATGTVNSGEAVMFTSCDVLESFIEAQG